MKQIKILNNRKLEDLKREFHQAFPFLRIEFYASAHEPGKGSAKRDQIDPAKTVGEVRQDTREGELSLDPEQTIKNLESRFKVDFGLNAQVFRKSGNQWLQTSTTDSWTLATANTKGEHSSDHFHRKYG